MKKLRISLVLFGLLLTLWPAMSLADSCSISYNCPFGGTISCSITAAPGNTTNCWAGPAAEVTCCEFNVYGQPIRDIHIYCGPPGGGGGHGGPYVP